MKKLIKDNKKIIITFSYVLLILAIAHFSLYNSSQAKYKKDIDEAIVFQNEDLYKLTNNSRADITIEKNSKSDDNKIYLDITFVRNNVGLKEGETDNYSITFEKAQSSCNVESLNNKAYSSNPAENSARVKAQVSCSLDSNILKNGEIVVPIVINEQVKNPKFNEDKFIYASETFKMDVNSYYPSLEFRVLKTESADFYNKLVSWLKSNYYNDYINGSYTDYSDTLNAVLDYVKIYEKADINSLPSLNGLKFSEDSQYYIFSVEPNFIGYAKTSFITTRQNNTGENVNMYFSDLDKLTDENLKTIFEEYLNTYFFPTNIDGNEKNIADIMNYINFVAPNGIANYIKNGIPANIIGLKRSLNGQLLIIDNILDYVNYSNPIIVRRDTFWQMQSTIIDYLENTLYGPTGPYGTLISDIVRNNLILNEEKLQIYDDIINAFTKNCNNVVPSKPTDLLRYKNYYTPDGEEKTFVDYFILYNENTTSSLDDDYYLIFSVYSDDKITNKGAITPIYIFKDVDVQFANGNMEDDNFIDQNTLDALPLVTTNLKITLTSSSSDNAQALADIKEAVEALDNYFGTSTSVGELTSTGDGFEYSYVITKNI